MAFERVLQFVKVIGCCFAISVDVAAVDRVPMNNYNGWPLFHIIPPDTPAVDVTAEQEAKWMDEAIKLRLPNGNPINIVEVMINRLFYQNPEDQTPTNELKTADKLRSREKFLAPLMKEILHGKADGSIAGRPKADSCRPGVSTENLKRDGRDKYQCDKLYGAGTMVQDLSRHMHSPYIPVHRSESSGSVSLIGNRPQTYSSWIPLEGHGNRIPLISMGLAWFGSSIINFWGDCGYPADGMSKTNRFVNTSRGKTIQRRCGLYLGPQSHLHFNSMEAAFFGNPLPFYPPDEASPKPSSRDSSNCTTTRFSGVSRRLLPGNKSNEVGTIIIGTNKSTSNPMVSESGLWEKKGTRNQRRKAFFYGVGDMFGTARIDDQRVPNVSNDSDFFDFVVGKNWESLAGRAFSTECSSSGISPLTWVGDHMDRYVAEVEAHLSQNTAEPDKFNITRIKKKAGGLPYNEFPIAQRRAANDRREVFKPHMLFFHYDGGAFSREHPSSTFFTKIRNLFQKQQTYLKHFLKSKKFVRGAIWKTRKKIHNMTGAGSTQGGEKAESGSSYEEQLDCFVLWAGKTAGDEASLQTLTSSFNFLDEMISRKAKGPGANLTQNQTHYGLNLTQNSVQSMHSMNSNSDLNNLKREDSEGDPSDRVNKSNPNDSSITENQNNPNDHRTDHDPDHNDHLEKNASNHPENNANDHLKNNASNHPENNANDHLKNNASNHLKNNKGRHSVGSKSRYNSKAVTSDKKNIILSTKSRAQDSDF